MPRQKATTTRDIFCIRNYQNLLFNNVKNTAYRLAKLTQFDIIGTLIRFRGSVILAIV